MTYTVRTWHGTTYAFNDGCLYIVAAEFGEGACVVSRVQITSGETHTLTRIGAFPDPMRAESAIKSDHAEQHGEPNHGACIHPAFCTETPDGIPANR